ncbi:MAG: hypothetical protein ACKOCH_04475, partial [Bacteroidota bacterium]
SEKLGIPVVFVSGRTGDNMNRLVLEIEKLIPAIGNISRKAFFEMDATEKQVAEAVRLNLGENNPYRALQLAHHFEWLPFLNDSDRATLATIVQTKNFVSLRAQVEETLARY